jgi:pfkB family carbohydrate kinase
MTNINKQRAAELVKEMATRNIVVLGDIMLDEFIWGDVTRVSPEAPVPVVDIRRESTHLGGAANVLANLLALGAKASVIGVVGDDFAGERIQSSVHDKSALQKEGVIILDKSRPTTIKTRIIAQNQMVVRADRENRTPVNRETEDQIISAVSPRSRLPMLWSFQIMTRASSPLASWPKSYRLLTKACRFSSIRRRETLTLTVRRHWSPPIIMKHCASRAWKKILMTICERRRG